MGRNLPFAESKIEIECIHIKVAISILGFSFAPDLNCWGRKLSLLWNSALLIAKARPRSSLSPAAGLCARFSLLSEETFWLSRSPWIPDQPSRVALSNHTSSTISLSICASLGTLRRSPFHPGLPALSTAPQCRPEQSRSEETKGPCWHPSSCKEPPFSHFFFLFLSSIFKYIYMVVRFLQSAVFEVPQLFKPNIRIAAVIIFG